MNLPYGTAERVWVSEANDQVFPVYDEDHRRVKNIEKPTKVLMSMHPHSNVRINKPDHIYLGEVSDSAL